MILAELPAQGGWKCFRRPIDTKAIIYYI